MEGADSFVIKEGWATKESGQAVLGQTNWRKRWCRLSRSSDGTFWAYYRFEKTSEPYNKQIVINV